MGKQKAAVSDSGYGQIAGDTPATTADRMHRKRLMMHGWKALISRLGASEDRFCDHEAHAVFWTS
jgi:hypothetical protein